MKCKNCGSNDSKREKCPCRQCVDEPWDTTYIEVCQECHLVIESGHD